MLNGHGFARHDVLDRRDRLLPVDGSGSAAARTSGDIGIDVAEKDARRRGDLREAAVLLPLLDRGNGAQLVLTRRTDTLRTHSGQVALPGGGIDGGDAGSPVRAALREAREEIGLASDLVEPIGLLPPYVSHSGYRIQPVVGLVSGAPVFRANPDEVAEVFEVPLAFLMDPANHRLESRDWRGVRRDYYVMTYAGHRIWGVTAGILRLFYDEVFR